MNDRDERFDRDLAAVLREIAGEEAPMSLRYRLSDITERAPMGRQSWFITPMRLSVVVAGLAVLAVALLLWPRADVGPGPSESPSPSQSQSQSVEPSATAEPTPTLVPSAEQPTTAPTLAPTPVPTIPPVQTSDWIGLDWSDGVVPFTSRATSSHQIGDEIVETAILDVVSWNGAYVAIGTIDRSIFGCGLMPEGCVDPPPAPAFFRSADARHWAVTKEFPVETNDSANTPQRLIVFGSRLLAFSRDTVWMSDDAVAWLRVDSPTWESTWRPTDTTFPRLISVAAGETAIIAVGQEAGSGASIILRSTDGVAWSAVGLSGMTDVVVRDAAAYSGGFVIVGRSGDPDSMSSGGDPDRPTMPVLQPGDGAPAAWTSPDGLAWSAASVEGVPVAGGGIEQVLVGEHGLYGVGFATPWSAGGGRTFTQWWSADGEAWHQSGQLGSDLPASPALAADGVNMVMLGPDPVAPETLAGWVSVDGRSWTRLAFTGSRDVSVAQWFEEISELVHRARVAWVVPDGVIANGQDYYDGLDDDTFWFGTATFGP